MISSIFEPLSDFADCSPSTQRIASVIFDLPLPFGPTTAVTPGTKSTEIRSANDLNPTDSSFFKYICSPTLFPNSLNISTYLFYHKTSDQKRYANNNRGEINELKRTY